MTSTEEMTSQPENHSFQAEVNQVLSIVVNSLYSHREVFLRELISNASDALDKLSFRSLTEDALKTEDELKVEIIPNLANNTLIIRDNGIGMTKEEMIENLGTIARSGSKKLMEALNTEDKDKVSLIGQFGVGFYSSFLVADKVTVTSRVAGADTAWQWTSEAKGDFTMETSEREMRGTNIILHLKEDAKEYLEEWTTKDLIRKYSDYVRYPIRLQVTRTEPVGEEKNEDGTPKETKVTLDWVDANQANALWTRPKSEISDDQYNEFYKHMSHDWEDPLARTHFRVEGMQELTGMLFLPKRAPMDLFEKKSHGVRLFVKRVFIMEDCAEILPEWLRFVRGVIDSEDLPLNVSREILQQDRTTQMIKKQVITKTLSLLEELADEGEVTTKIENEGDDKKLETETTTNRYQDFWNAFGRIFKEGVHFDPTYKDRLSKLLRYSSTEESGLTSFEDYVSRMKDGQDDIYYITGDSLDTCRNSPHLEALKKAGYEVIFMADPVDEWVVQSLAEFDGKKFVSAAKGGLDLPETEEEKKEQEEKTTEFQGLLDGFKSTLEERVSEVRLTNRLTDSPACLVTDENGLSPHLERILRANGQEVPAQKRILELNAEHAVVKNLQALATDENKAGEIKQWGSLLFDQALLAEGTMPEDPAAFARSVTELMQKAVD